MPTLGIGLAFTMRTAVGTSLAIITATSLLGFVTHVPQRILAVMVVAVAVHLLASVLLLGGPPGAG